MTCIRLTKDLLIIESGECCNTGLHNICPARAFLVARESFLNCRNSKLLRKSFGYNYCRYRTFSRFLYNEIEFCA